MHTFPFTLAKNSSLFHTEKSSFSGRAYAVAQRNTRTQQKFHHVFPAHILLNPNNCFKPSTNQQVRTDIEPVICISFLHWLQMSSSGIQSHLCSGQFGKHDLRFDCLYCKWKIQVYKDKKLVVLKHSFKKVMRLGVIVQIPWVPSRINYYDACCLGKSKSTNLCGQ